tara:strand:+ start:2576 stop:3445 length:870 start_codon:yes stop_codon:yes gene_type:complete
MFLKEELKTYLYWIEERENIRIQKEELNQTPPWTEDPILKEYKFCQVFRNDDRTSRWYIDNIRNPLENSEEVFMATVIFRWFNLIQTGETLLKHNLHINWDSELANEKIREQDQWITGAYVIKSPDGYDKLKGISLCIDYMWEQRKEILAKANARQNSMQDMWLYIKSFPFQGPFMAYEIVTDLSFTKFGRNAKDRLTWANAGPGAMRGLNRLTGRDLDFKKKSHDWVGEMNELYKICRYLLPKSIFNSNRHPFELREVEGGLCEFDKYSRILKGQGRTRSKYAYNTSI